MLAYCDYIADRIKNYLNYDIQENKTYTKIGEVGPIQMALHPVDGYFLSTKKVLTVKDIYGKIYKVTVEEVEND